MKRLYEFTIAKEELVKESETTKNDSGEEETTPRKSKSPWTKSISCVSLLGDYLMRQRCFMA